MTITDAMQADALRQYRKVYRGRVRLDGTDTREIDHRLGVLREWMTAEQRKLASQYERSYRRQREAIHGI
jgi:hypothetical protein